MVEMDVIYGHRARIGYASPPLLTEVFAYDFYRLAPAGVTLALTSLAILDRNKDEVDRSYEISMQAARAMASSGVDLVVLGGVTINLSRGYANADRMLADLSSEARRQGHQQRGSPDQGIGGAGRQEACDREALPAAWRIQPQ